MNKPSMFRLVGMPYRFFGETHVVISVWREQETWMAEYSILSNRPQEHLVQCVIDFDTSGYPSELPPVDDAFMEAEALQQAKVGLTLELENRALAAGREDLAYMPIELERESLSPMSLWVRNAYPAKFADMAAGTKSSVLKNFLQVVMSMRRLKSAGG